jgi:hypothetical protein
LDFGHLSVRQYKHQAGLPATSSARSISNPAIFHNTSACDATLPHLTNHQLQAVTQQTFATTVAIMSSRSRVGFEDDYYRDQRRDDVEVRIRDRSRSRDRLPSFMREDLRRPEPGPLVLRQREVETAERRRRSPSPVRVRETRIVRARSVSPAPPRRTEEDLRYRTVIREPNRGPDMERLRTRIRDRSSSSSPSPDRARERIRARIVERGRSPSPVHEHIRIVEKSRERRPRSPSPSPPPPPQVIKGPIIEREVITHYRDIDHGKLVRLMAVPAINREQNP